ncbi:DUF6600 domain-containing protein [Pedobacter rhizosphaerae]|uniref:YXWGXW repeat-containing protein n=1 Tax=Pedobacter rhizosphaerae TaxID=390241 RepID=A0A1H9RP70_9SPHI|nr:DUF6600 domain-containing protein [Pedobacter rhizosphaerae]SER73689.1 hypothetical protein SAMN04488023_11522 [Pedobacter rhizosphaerae]
MKTLKKSALVLGLFALLAGTTTLVRAQGYPDSYQDDEYYNDGNVSLQTFYDELSPYGTWIQDPQYGYVWRPDVNQADFRPYYTNGRWVMTEYGNTWVSNYDWGWAPFHYGRWVYNSYRQWIWLPDTNWGPAWVDWRSGDGYYGWAPMAPSISINISFGRRYVVPDYCWNFIPQANIYVNTFPRYDYGRNNVYIRNTTIINNTYVYNRRTYYGGPRAEDIRRATNRDVRVYRFSQSSRPGASRVGGREVSIYRPRTDRNVDNRSAAPKKFDRGNAGFTRNGREGMANRDNRGNNNGNDNRFGTRPDRSVGQPNRGNEPNNNRGNNSSASRDDRFNNNGNGRTQRADQNNNADWRNRQAGAERTQQQQREQQNQRFERTQQDRVSQEQQRAQRDAQMQQRQQQVEQQRSAQMEQQRSQRDAQAQQQRQQQADQQRAQRNEQMQQQRQQMEQQRAQRNNEQMQQQRAQQDQQRQQAQQQQREAQAQQRAQQQQQQMQQRQEQRRSEAPQQQNRGGERGSSEGGRPSRGGRG